MNFSSEGFSLHRTQRLQASSTVGGLSFVSIVPATFDGKSNTARADCRKKGQLQSATGAARSEADSARFDLSVPNGSEVAAQMARAEVECQLVN